MLGRSTGYWWGNFAGTRVGNGGFSWSRNSEAGSGVVEAMVLWLGAMAEAPPTPGATLRGTGGSVLSSTNGGNHHHIEEDPEPNTSTKSAIIYKTSQNPKPEQPLTSRHSSGSRKSKTVSFHSATSLPTERKISSGKLHISPTWQRITFAFYFAAAFVLVAYFLGTFSLQNYLLV